MLKIYQLRLKQNTFEVTMRYRGVGVRVAFVDGNSYNDIPAKCYTNDPFKQRAIEASQMFKDKDIVLERSVEEESDRQKAKEAADKANKPDEANKTDKADKINGADTPDEGDAGSEKKTFDNLGEAIMYVAQTFGIAAKTEAEVRKTLKEHGVSAVIKKG